MYAESKNLELSELRDAVGPLDGSFDTSHGVGAVGGCGEEVEAQGRRCRAYEREKLLCRLACGYAKSNVLEKAGAIRPTPTDKTGRKRRRP